MGQLLKIAIVPATLLWGAFSYNHYKCEIKGFCGSPEKEQQAESKLPDGMPTNKIKSETAHQKNNIAEAYNQGTNNKEEAWANENIEAFENKANQ